MTSEFQVSWRLRILRPLRRKGGRSRLRLLCQDCLRRIGEDTGCSGNQGAEQRTQREILREQVRRFQPIGPGKNRSCSSWTHEAILKTSATRTGSQERITGSNLLPYLRVISLNQEIHRAQFRSSSLADVGFSACRHIMSVRFPRLSENVN